MDLIDIWNKFEETGSVKAYLLYKSKEKMMLEMSKELSEENVEVEE